MPEDNELDWLLDGLMVKLFDGWAFKLRAKREEKEKEVRGNRKAKS